jgi:hypothetical protein
MDISEALKSIQNTGIASSIRDSLFLFPGLEAIHVVGFALVFGTIAIIDFRLLGLASRNRRFQNIASDVLKWTWLAFGITFVSGALMFSTNAVVYFHNPIFRAKMVVLLLAGLNMAIFELTTGRSAERWGAGPSAPMAGKTTAVLSLILWVSIIFLGRWIGFSVARSSPTENNVPAEINFDDIFNGATQDNTAPPTPSSTPEIEK